MKDMTDLCQAVGSELTVEILNKHTEPIVFENALPALETDGQPAGSNLPPIKSARDLIQTIIPVPGVVVHGLLHEGSKMVLGGGSKSYKTFCLIDLAVSVSQGMQWWGMDTTKGRVLYINFEIQEPFFKARLDAVLEAKGLGLEIDDYLDIWNLRGYCADLSTLMAPIIERVKDRAYSLIIIDPIYKGMGDRDENSAGDINSLLNEIEKLAVQSGAAVVFGAHFSKGNQAGKESIDRISGSGVFARDPDSILVMTKHENEDTYTVEATLRNFKPIAPFCIRWNHPLMERDETLDPEKLKKPGASATKYTPLQLKKILGVQTLFTKEWLKQTCDATGMSERTFAAKKKELVDAAEVVMVGSDKWKAVPPIYPPGWNSEREKENQEQKQKPENELQQTAIAAIALLQ